MNQRNFTPDSIRPPIDTATNGIDWFIWENLHESDNLASLLLDMFQCLNLETNTVRQDILLVRERWGR